MKFTLLLTIFSAAILFNSYAQDKAITPVSEILKELGTIPQAPTEKFQAEPLSVSLSGEGQSDEQQTHVVKKGENPWTIAKRYGVSMDELVKINHIGNSRDIKIGQELKLPARKPTSTTSSAPVTSKTSEQPAFDAQGYDVYSIKNGDNPWTIARKLKVNYETLLEINTIDNPRDLKIGQKLRIPKPGQKPSGSIEGPMPLPKSAASEVPFDADGHEVHSVKRGENPWTIARKLKVDYKQLIELNQIDNPKDIKVGLKLKIPKKG